MKSIVKNQPIKIEFGDYDNFANMIPIDIVKHRPDDYYKVLIRWQYPNDKRTIELWHSTDNDVDFESFGFVPQEVSHE